MPPLSRQAYTKPLRAPHCLALLRGAAQANPSRCLPAAQPPPLTPDGLQQLAARQQRNLSAARPPLAVQAACSSWRPFSSTARQQRNLSAARPPLTNQAACSSWRPASRPAARQPQRRTSSPHGRRGDSSLSSARPARLCAPQSNIERRRCGGGPSGGAALGCGSAPVSAGAHTAALQRRRLDAGGCLRGPCWPCSGGPGMRCACSSRAAGGPCLHPDFKLPPSFSEFSSHSPAFESKPSHAHLKPYSLRAGNAGVQPVFERSLQTPSDCTLFAHLFCVARARWPALPPPLVICFRSWPPILTCLASLHPAHAPTPPLFKPHNTRMTGEQKGGGARGEERERLRSRRVGLGGGAALLAVL